MVCTSLGPLRPGRAAPFRSVAGDPVAGAGTTSHAVFAVSDRLVDRYAALRPMLATVLGLPGHDHEWGDLGPDGVAAERDLVAATGTELDGLPPADERWAGLAVRVLADELAAQAAVLDAGERHLDVAHGGSTVQAMHDVLEIQPTATVEQREALLRRLETFGVALAGWRATVDVGRASGRLVAQRQAESVARRLRVATAEGGSVARVVAGVAAADPGLAGRLSAGLEQVRAASHDTARWLETVYLPQAPAADGVGPDRYARQVRHHLRTDIDLTETYAWGWEQLAVLRQRATAAARAIDRDATLPEVIGRLATDPTYAAPTPEAFRELMLDRQRRALEELDGSHFAVPPEVREVAIRLAAPSTPPEIWYRPPSEDHTRPGTIWYALGPVERVPLYDQVAIAYHEGFPGHHLQLGLQQTFADRLSRAHRLLVWIAGYGEGWALYAEQLMDELGYYEQPAYVLGYLASSLLRAVRIVVDIGLHLGLAIPTHVPFQPGERWTYELAVAALEELAFEPPHRARSDVARYLGAPGQAISYAVGRRMIVELREERRRRDGAAFDLAAFHADVIGSGPVGLDHLRELVLGRA
jgi:uncharacterized protein (DUF885 family)